MSRRVDTEMPEHHHDHSPEERRHEELLAALQAVKKHLTKLERKIEAMATNINEKLDGLLADIQTEVQQVKDAIAAGNDATAQLESVSTRIDEMRATLQSDDPAAPPAETPA